MKLNETNSFGDQELMSCMFKIMLVICIIYYSLKITFIIPYNKFQIVWVVYLQPSFWEPAKKLFETCMELMDTMRFVMHKNALPGNKIYI